MSEPRVDGSGHGGRVNWSPPASRGGHRVLASRVSCPEGALTAGSVGGSVRVGRGHGGAGVGGSVGSSTAGLARRVGAPVDRPAVLGVSLASDLALVAVLRVGHRRVVHQWSSPGARPWVRPPPIEVEPVPCRSAVAAEVHALDAEAVGVTLVFGCQSLDGKRAGRPRPSGRRPRVALPVGLLVHDGLGPCLLVHDGLVVRRLVADRPLPVRPGQLHPAFAVGPGAHQVGGLGRQTALDLPRVDAGRLRLPGPPSPILARLERVLLPVLQSRGRQAGSGWAATR